MHATLLLNDPLSRRGFERRASERAKIALPILIAIGWTKYGALVHDLSSEGAMIETTAPLLVNSEVEIHCGSIRTGGVVLWQTGDRFGIKFREQATPDQVGQQVMRSDAAANWREDHAARKAKPPPSD